MDIREALEDVLGERLASSITADMGQHWAIVAATADPRFHERPRAAETIRAHLAEQKRKDSRP